jgi:hypothetical protein
MPTTLAAVLGVSGVFVLAYFLFPEPLVALATSTASTLF